MPKMTLPDAPPPAPPIAIPAISKVSSAKKATRPVLKNSGTPMAQPVLPANLGFNPANLMIQQRTT